MEKKRRVIVPDNSKAGYRKYKKNASVIRRGVVLTLGDYGSATDEVLSGEPLFDNCAPSSPRNARHDLHEDGLVKPVGTTENSRGHKVTCWGLTSDGKKLYRRLVKSMAVETPSTASYANA